jgi:hypothetical protein
MANGARDLAGGGRSTNEWSPEEKKKLEKRGRGKDTCTFHVRGQHIIIRIAITECSILNLLDLIQFF